MAITLGDRADIQASSSTWDDVCWVSDTKFVAAYCDTDGETGLCVVGTVAGTDISLGNIETFQPSKGQTLTSINVVKCSEDRVAFVYRSEGSLCRTADISGTSLSFNDEIRWDSSSDLTELSAFEMSSSYFGVANIQGTVIVANILEVDSGGDISGGPDWFINKTPLTAEHCAGIALTDTVFACTYLFDDNNFEVILFSYLGGSINVIDTFDTSQSAQSARDKLNVAAIDSQRFVVAYTQLDDDEPALQVFRNESNQLEWGSIWTITGGTVPSDVELLDIGCPAADTVVIAVEDDVLETDFYVGTIGSDPGTDWDSGISMDDTPYTITTNEVTELSVSSATDVTVALFSDGDTSTIILRTPEPPEPPTDYDGKIITGYSKITISLDKRYSSIT